MASLRFGGTRKLAPANQFDVSLLQKFSKVRACEKVKVALPPRRAPGIALACGRTHFFIRKSQMNNKFGHAGLQIVEGFGVEVRPLLWGSEERRVGKEC